MYAWKIGRLWHLLTRLKLETDVKYPNYSPKLNSCIVFLFLVYINCLLNPGKLNHAGKPLLEKNIYKFIYINIQIRIYKYLKIYLIYKCILIC